MRDLRVVILGTGRVAHALGQALHNVGVQIPAVYGRSPEGTASLAGRLGTAAANEIEALPADADVYVLAVKDDAIAQVAQDVRGALSLVERRGDTSVRILLHTSGTVSMTALNGPGSFATGVFYPLQSFTGEGTPDFREIPICICASNAGTETRLLQLAATLHAPAHLVSDEERLRLHLAAVMMNNFSVHWCALSADWLTRNGQDWFLLQPLMAATFQRLSTSDPRVLQTGPALRGDHSTLQKHLELLASEPELAELYRRMSDSIRRMAEKTAPPHAGNTD